MSGWLEPSEIAWSDAGVDWTVRLHWGECSGSIECVGIELRQGETVRPLTAAALRRFKLGEAIARAKAERYDELGGSLAEAYAAAIEGDPTNVHLLDAVGPSFADELAARAAPFAPKGRGRPKEHGLAHYREVAATYSRARMAGSAPRQAVKERFVVSLATASRWIAQARAHGLLPQTDPGRTGAPGLTEDVSKEEG